MGCNGDVRGCSRVQMVAGAGGAGRMRGDAGGCGGDAGRCRGCRRPHSFENKVFLG